MSFLIRFLFLLFLFIFLQRFLRALLPRLFSPHGTRSADPVSPQSGSVVKHGTMEKDPVCGTYVDTASSLKLTVDGQAKYFCSEDCLKKYRKRA
jgi:YHS domain-containing protein